MNNIKKLLHSKTVRNGGLFSIFSFFNRGIAFLLLILLAEYINPEQYGELSLFNTLVMFLGYFAGLSTAGYLSVSYFKRGKNYFNKDFSAICVITCVVSLLIAILFVVLHQYLSELLKVPVPFLYIGVIISFVNIFVQLNLDYLRVQEKVSMYGVLSCSFALLNLLFSLYLVIAADLNWYGRVYAQLVCDVIFGLIALAWFIKDGLLTFPKDWEIYKMIILWGAPIIPHQASGWIKQGLDRYIINVSHSMADVGLFSFALNIASVILMIGIAFNQTNSVNLYQTLSTDMPNDIKYKKLQTKVRNFSFLYFTATVLIIILGSICVPIALPKYSDSVPYFILLTIYGFLHCQYFLYCNYLFYYSKTSQLMWITFGSSIIHLLLSFALTRYSLYYTAIVYIISQGLVTTFVFIQGKKILHKQLLGLNKYEITN